MATHEPQPRKAPPVNYDHTDHDATIPWWRQTYHRRTVYRLLILVLTLAVLVGTAIGWAAGSHAEGYGCERVAQPTLLNWGQKRTICDGPRRPDGSWERTRRLWTPAGYVRGSSYCGTYSCSYSEGYYRDESTQELTSYVVFDANVLPGEPGWLPPGTVSILG